MFWKYRGFGAYINKNSLGVAILPNWSARLNYHLEMKISIPHLFHSTIPPFIHALNYLPHLCINFYVSIENGVKFVLRS